MKSLKENGFIKKLIDNEKSIIEGIVVSLVGAFALTSLLTGSFDKLTELNFAATASLVKTIAILLVAAILMGVIYFFNKMWAKVAMFFFVMVYFLAAGYASTVLEGGTTTANPIAQVCFLAVTGFLAVIAFLYVKDDFFKAQEKLKINNKAMIAYTVLVGLFLVTVTTVIGIYRYASFSAPTADFGIFAQAFQNMKETGACNTVVERGYDLSHFAVHFSPIFYVVLPIYFLIPKAETVIVIQSIMVALPVIPIFLLGRQFKLSNKVTMVIMAIYALFPATVGGILYDFHENCFLTFMILMLIWAVEKKKNITAIVFLILTFMIKEDAGIYVIILGVFWIVSRRSRLRGLIAIVSSGIMYVVSTAIVKSFGLAALDSYSLDTVRFANLLPDQQGSMFQMIKVFITNPGYVITQIISNAPVTQSDPNAGASIQMDKIGFIIAIFVPIGILLFSVGKKYSRYILLGSIVLFSLITTYVYLHNIGWQYNFGHIALMMYLIFLNVSDMKPKKQKKLVVSSAIICAIMFVGLMFPICPKYINTYKANSTRIEQINEAIDKVPTDKSVFTTTWIMPHMSNNIKCYDIGSGDPATNQKNGTPEYPDYLLVDETADETAKGRFNTLTNSGRYEVIFESKDNANNGTTTTGTQSTIKVYKLKK